MALLSKKTTIPAETDALPGRNTPTAALAANTS